LKSRNFIFGKAKTKSRVTAARLDKTPDRTNIGKRQRSCTAKSRILDSRK
jgi:hypothetical protein